jgi:hypothetical protein
MVIPTGLVIEMTLPYTKFQVRTKININGIPTQVDFPITSPVIAAYGVLTTEKLALSSEY